MPKHSPPQDAEFLMIIAMLMAMVALAINAILPAFHAMTLDFELKDSNMIGLTVSLLYAGLAVGQVFFGSLSDNIGRKPTLNLGLGLFLIGAALSALAADFNVLILGQVVQGIGLGAPRVVTLAIVRDRYSGDAMARAMSFIMMIFVTVPMASPYLGQGVVLASHWRMIFVVFIVLSVLLLAYMNMRLGETLPVTRRQPLSFRGLAGLVLKVLRDGKAMGYAATLGLVSSPFIAYLNMSQQVLEQQYSLGTAYPLVFALLSVWLGTASFVNGRIVMRFGMEHLSGTALVLTAGLSAALALGMVAIGRQPPLALLIAYMGVMLFCFGILVSNLNALAMHSLGKIAGTGAATVGAVSTLISIPFAILIGAQYAGSVLPLVGGFGLCGSAALFLFSWLQRGLKSTRTS